MSTIHWPKLTSTAWRTVEAKLSSDKSDILLEDNETTIFPNENTERLISILENAQSGSNRLSREVALAAGWSVVGKDLNGREIWLSPDSRGTSWLPPFSQSLDAALKLIPDGQRRPMEIRLAVHDRISGGRSTCEVRDFVGPRHVCVRRALAVAKTAALATCIAALRTRAALAMEEVREHPPAEPASAD
jgi:hypothetical protein